MLLLLLSSLSVAVCPKNHRQMFLGMKIEFCECAGKKLKKVSSPYCNNFTSKPNLQKPHHRIFQTYLSYTTSKAERNWSNIGGGDPFSPSSVQNDSVFELICVRKNNSFNIWPISNFYIYVSIKFK